jgi:uncharacterized protein (TIGR02996 family)
MPTDADFLRKLLDNPAEDTVRLVYADWLDEQSDPESIAKAAFLRGTVSLSAPSLPARKRKVAKKKLQKLAAGLETEWLGVVSKLKLENCQKKESPPLTRGLRQAFQVICNKKWEELAPTDAPGARFCESCRESVYYCDTIVVAREHAESGHCVAIDLGVIRRRGDLDPRELLMGFMSSDFMAQEEERRAPDQVSAEREQRKQERAGGTAGG